MQSTEVADMSFDAASDTFDEVTFFSSRRCCVCMVDIIASTRTAAQIKDAEKVAEYYSIFLNSMALSVKSFGARIIKTAGDSLLFSFPKTEDCADKNAFMDFLQCCIAMMYAGPLINMKMKSRGLPPVSYRISADYGEVEVAWSRTLQSEDLFGSTVNICAKINGMASPNGLVIGGDLYRVIKKLSLNSCNFKELYGYSIGFKQTYPVYTVCPDCEAEMADIKNKITNILSPKAEYQHLKQPTGAPVKKEKNSKPNVILVDDEHDVAVVYSMYLASRDYSVQAFEDPREALQNFKGADPSFFDLAVLDIRMPHINGLQLCQRFMALNPAIKILFVTAVNATKEMISVLPGMENAMILEKPVGWKRFVDAVDEILRGPPPRTLEQCEYHDIRSAFCA